MAVAEATTDSFGEIELAELVYSTNLSLSGPWLLDDAALTHLGDVLEPEWNRLCARWEETVDEEVRCLVSMYQQYHEGQQPDDEILGSFQVRAKAGAGPKDLRIVLRLRGGHSLVVKSFRDALRSPELVDQTPLGLTVDMHCVEVRASLAVGKYKHSDELELTTSPESSPLARELFVILRNWAVAHQAPW